MIYIKIDKLAIMQKKYLNYMFINVLFNWSFGTLALTYMNKLLNSEVYFSIHVSFC